MAELLFVDDDQNFVSDLGAKVEAETGIGTISTTDWEEAIEIAAKQPIKVAILDQRMPGLTGVELMKEIHKVDPDIRVIVLSGLASDQEIVDAYDGGAVKFLQKNQQRLQLVDLILEQVHTSDRRLAQRSMHLEPIYTVRRGLPWVGSQIRYYLTSVTVVDENYYFDNESDWTTPSNGRLDVGASIESKVLIDWSRILERSTSFEEIGSSELSLSAGQLTKLNAGLDYRLGKREEFRLLVESRQSVEIKRSLSVQPGQASGSRAQLKSRSFQVTPVFMKLHVSVVGACSRCDTRHLHRMASYLPRPRIATRQVDHFSQRSPEVTFTGFEDL